MRNDNPTILDQLNYYNDRIRAAWQGLYDALERAKHVRPEIQRALPPHLGHLGRGDPTDPHPDVPTQQEQVQLVSPVPRKAGDPDIHNLPT